MARLKEEIVIPLADYEPKPGSSRMNIVAVDVERDSMRKAIILSMGIEYRGPKCRKFEIYSGMGKRIKLADSPTHSPKAFATIAANALQPFRSRQGEQWDQLTELLSKFGLSAAPEGSAPWLDPNE